MAQSKIPLALVSAAVLVAVFSIIVSAIRSLSSLENTLLWVISLALSLVGSFYIGKESASEAVHELIRPHARSAFRRLMSLYGSLSRVATEIAISKSPESQKLLIAKLEAIVVEQLATADDALEDWRDIAPDEVTELKSRLIVAEKREVESDGSN